jgi:pyruvate/2-oxoglutarate dehydrogenase complex dihydrolipoamide acyltransferase (E2) component
MNRASTAAVIAVLLLAGCGGGNNDNGKTGTAQTQATETQTQSTTPTTTTAKPRGKSGTSGAKGHKSPARKQSVPLSPADRHALRQIGVAISAIRRAAPSGSPRRRAALETLLPQVGALQAQDPRLLRLKALTVKALGDAIRVAGRSQPKQRDRAAVAADLSLLRQSYSSLSGGASSP